jgi:hypothetical protein
MARCMLKSKELPDYFWGEAVTTVLHILKRSPTCVVDGKTTYATWHGEAPIMHYFRTFCCLAHVKITHARLRKLEDRKRKIISLLAMSWAPRHTYAMILSIGASWCHATLSLSHLVLRSKLDTHSMYAQDLVVIHMTRM